MINDAASYEDFSGFEEGFGPVVYGGDVARLRPAKHFVGVEPVEIEPTRLFAAAREPLTEEEMEEILAEYNWREQQGHFNEWGEPLT